MFCFSFFPSYPPLSYHTDQVLHLQRCCCSATISRKCGRFWQEMVSLCAQNQLKVALFLADCPKQRQPDFQRRDPIRQILWTRGVFRRMWCQSVLCVLAMKLPSCVLDVKGGETSFLLFCTHFMPSGEGENKWHLWFHTMTRSCTAPMSEVLPLVASFNYGFIYWFILFCFVHFSTWNVSAFLKRTHVLKPTMF